MKVLVVGGGGREDALCYKTGMSPLVSEVVCAPGNAGISKRARCAAVSPEDIDGLVSLALEEKPGLTVVGPEAPLALGLVDRLEAEGLRVFGPSKAAAAIEGSKVFSKNFMHRHGIPTADFKVFDNIKDAAREVEGAAFPLVLKADGLAAGKGVFVCAGKKEADAALAALMRDRAFGDSGDRVVMESFLPGEEVSFFAVSDGKTAIPLEPSQDHKRLLDGDRGPNTGGMGAYAPAPVATPELRRRVMEEVIKPAVAGMADEGIPYKGVLYAGLMTDGDGIRTLEFNCRFGDPETQPLMMRMESDIVPLLLASADGTLADEKPPVWSRGAAACVIMAADGYPGGYARGAEIRGADGGGSVEVFHSGTAEKNGAVVTNGGRVLGVTAAGGTLREAVDAAYEKVAEIEKQTGAGILVYRKDIAAKAFGRLKRKDG